MLVSMLPCGASSLLHPHQYQSRNWTSWACSLPEQASISAGLVDDTLQLHSRKVESTTCKLPPPPCPSYTTSPVTVPTGAFTRALLSYAYYAPANYSTSVPGFVQCVSNLRFLLDKLPLDPTVELVVSVIGSSAWPPRGISASRISNTRVRYARQAGVDVYTHWELLNEIRNSGSLDSYSHFVFTNCGSRGPYVHAHCHQGRGRSKDNAASIIPQWLLPFIQRMHQTNAVLVGPSMSCGAGSAHVQTHFIVATGLAVRRLILTRWKPPARDEAGDHVGIADRIIRFVEVGLGDQAVKEGMSIADLYADQTLCENSVHQSWIGINPSVMAVDPYSLVFVKQGGSLVARYKEYASSGQTFDFCKRLLLQVADSYHRACLAHGRSALLSALDQLAAVPKCCSKRKKQEEEEEREGGEKSRFESGIARSHARRRDTIVWYSTCVVP